VIFRVALFRFATDGRVGGFDGAALESAFRPKKRRRQ
jgi:hypothetical protein